MKIQAGQPDFSAVCVNQSMEDFADVGEKADFSMSDIFYIGIYT